MDKKSENEMHDLLSAANNAPTHAKEDKLSPLERLGNSLVDFMNDQLTALNRQETFRMEIMNALLQQIHDGALAEDPHELRMLFKTVSEQKNVSMEAILQIFKPAQGAQINPYIPQQKKADDDLEDVFGNLSDEEKQTFDRFLRIVQSKDV